MIAPRHLTRAMLLAACLLGTRLQGQTFSSAPNGHIQDVAVTDFPMTVSGLVPGTLDTTSFGLETVCVNLTHTWNSDLIIQIVAPDGTVGTLASSVGGADDNFTNTCFNDNAAQSITNGVAPFTGTFKPQGQMGFVNNGQNGNGTWILRITDQVGGDDGTLLDWNITFGSNPAGYFSFSSSDLPIVKINTLGQQIVDDPKIMASMGIIDHGPGQRNFLTDPPNDYNGRIGIELRGSSSQGRPKKPYSVELWDLNGNAINAPILGMPAESDWVLNACYADKSLMRNALAFRLGEAMGMYAPRGKFVELVINGEYLGVYYLCERIKRDGNRVDIANLQYADTTGDQLTGGYILKVDKLTGSNPVYWNSLFPPPYAPGGNAPEIILHDPNPNSIHPKQVAYIHAYVDSFERALHGPGFSDPVHGFRRYADDKSMADYLLLTEFVRCLDGYRSSAFFYKDKNSKGGKLKFAPPWDYDLAFGNGDFCDMWKPEGWGHQFNAVCPGDGWLTPFWWTRVQEDSIFVQDVRCRWEALKYTVMDTTRIRTWIDSVAVHVQEGQQRNFTVWPILGVYVWPNYYIPADYPGEVDVLKWYIGRRWVWIDQYLNGDSAACNLVAVPDPVHLPSLQVWPNPTRDQVRVAFDSPVGNAYRLQVLDLRGRLLRVQAGESLTGHVEATLALGELPAGVYLLQVQDGAASRTVRLVRE